MAITPPRIPVAMPCFPAAPVPATLFLATFVLAAPAVGQDPTQKQIDETQAIELSDDPAAIIAHVGQTPILLGDLMPKVEARIRDVTAKSGQEIPEDQLHFARINLLRGLLNQAIQQKMMRESFLIEQVGTASAEDREEADKKLASKARQMFFDAELPQLKKQYEVQDERELDELLRKKGSSLSARQRDFVDMMLGHLYIRESVNRDPNVSIAEIVEYYLANRSEFERPTRARWEQLTVKFANHATRRQAREKITKMGKEAYFGGNVQAVARAQSEEPLARVGGLHDWTPQGSLVSEPLDEQIFSIPLNQMSEIIEDDRGLHIIRVLERTQAGLVALSEVQDDIRAKVRKTKIARSQAEVMKRMRDRIPVWSLFPEDIPGAQPLPENLTSGRRTSSIR